MTKKEHPIWGQIEGFLCGMTVIGLIYVVLKSFVDAFGG